MSNHAWIIDWLLGFVSWLLGFASAAIIAICMWRNHTTEADHSTCIRHWYGDGVAGEAVKCEGMDGIDLKLRCTREHAMATRDFTEARAEWTRKWKEAGGE